MKTPPCRNGHTLRPLPFALCLLLVVVVSPAFGKGGGAAGGGSGTASSSSSSSANGSTPAAPAAAPKPVAPPVNYVDTMLQIYDSNHDGQLEKDELHQLWLNDREKGDEALKFDKDHNLMLDRDEISAWREFVRIKLANAAKQAAAAAPAGGN